MKPENDLVKIFVEDVSKGIPKFINVYMPRSKPYELYSDDAEILANAFVNFAAINCALISRSLVKKLVPVNPEVSAEDFRQSFFDMMDRKCKLLFTKVFMENMEDEEGI